MTAHGLRPCRACGVVFKGIGRGAYCSTACRCGTDAGYQGGCRCTGCRAAHARTGKRLRVLGGQQLVSSLGSNRRVQALGCLGWSRHELSRRLGRHPSYLTQMLRSDHITATNAAAVAVMYDELSMTPASSTVADRVAATARSRGWAPPLAWDEGTLDDPNAKPYGDAIRAARAAAGVDDAVIDRFLAGEHTLPTTRAERIEIARRWVAAGRSLADLGRATGWKPERYFRLSDQTATAA